MAKKKNTHGGSGRNQGRKPLSEEEKKTGISLTVYATNYKINKLGKQYLKLIAKNAAQEKIDNLF